MGYSLFPFILIILSLAVIIVIIVRKFPQLSLLDVDTIPEVKEGKKKDEMLRKRAHEAQVREPNKGANLEHLVGRLSLWWKTLQRRLREFVQFIYDRLQEEKRKEQAERTAKTKTTSNADGTSSLDNDEKVIRDLINQGNHALQEGNLDLAEKKFISIIRMDAKHAEAYAKLGFVYLEQKQLEEAKQTFEFLLQLVPENYEAYMRLAEIAEQERQLSVAVEYYQQAVLLADDKPEIYSRMATLLVELDHYDTARIAMKEAVEIQPNNPRYLDMLIELDIICGKKDDARTHLEAFRMVNPENKKISLLKEKIDRMEDPEEVSAEHIARTT